MRSRIKKLTDKEIELIGLLEERRVTIKDRLLLMLVKEGMTFKDAKRHVRFNIKSNCMKREFKKLNETFIK